MTDISRRKADRMIDAGAVKVNGQTATTGAKTSGDEQVTINGSRVEPRKQQLLLLHKPLNYVCSTTRQDNKPTIYELLPADLHHLSYAGRLDADSEGLVILTNDGQLINRLTHPSFEVTRRYELQLDRPLSDTHLSKLEIGVELEDGVSRFDTISIINRSKLSIALHEGRNRQIRRTFRALGYEVTELKRISHGEYSLDDIASGEYILRDISD